MPSRPDARPVLKPSLVAALVAAAIVLTLFSPAAVGHHPAAPTCGARSQGSSDLYDRSVEAKCTHGIEGNDPCTITGRHCIWI